MAYYDTWAEKLRDRGVRKRLLIIVTLVLWAVLITMSLIIAENSRRVSFNGAGLRLVSYSMAHFGTPANLVLVDNAGNYMHVETAAGTIWFHSAFVVEYLGETFTHDPPSALLPPRFVEQIDRIFMQDPVAYNEVTAVIIFGALLILLGTGMFIYPFEFWEFSRKFNWSIEGGEPTEFGIFMQQVGGVILVILAFAFLFALR